jgi:hypothetical protein
LKFSSIAYIFCGYKAKGGRERKKEEQKGLALDNKADLLYTTPAAETR